MYLGLIQNHEVFWIELSKEYKRTSRLEIAAWAYSKNGCLITQCHHEAYCHPWGFLCGGKTLNRVQKVGLMCTWLTAVIEAVISMHPLYIFMKKETLKLLGMENYKPGDLVGHLTMLQEMKVLDIIMNAYLISL